jgi:Kdo2-lipid IVA lauroyltransferase/acyltransferase
VLTKISRYGPREWTDLFRLEGLEHVEEALARGRGAIAFTAHYGCWEAMAPYLSRLAPSAIIVRPFDNPRLEAFMAGVRASGGGRIISNHHALSDGLKALRENRLLGILVDQNFALGRLFVHFMGRPAATTPIVSLLARRAGCAVLPLHNVWENGRVRIIFEPALELSRSADRSLAVAEDTQAMTQVVEGWIRKDPGQWFWLHRRWKRRPQPGEFVYRPRSYGLAGAAPVLTATAAVDGTTPFETAGAAVEAVDEEMVMG